MNSDDYCLIVDDHAEARHWLSGAAADAFPELRVETAGTVMAATRCIDNNPPQIALLDIGLPDGSGLDLVDELDLLRRKNGQDITIIVSTVMNDDESIFDAIRRGADGYLLKEEPRESLVVLLHGINDKAFSFFFVHCQALTQPE